MLNIYNTYVLMQSQSDCDEAKAICGEYGLPCWSDGFKLDIHYNRFGSYKGNFGIWSLPNKEKISLTRFKELCEEWKKLNK